MIVRQFDNFEIETYEVVGKKHIRRYYAINTAIAKALIVKYNLVIDPKMSMLPGEK